MDRVEDAVIGAAARVRVGAAGHRVLAEPDRVLAGIERALAHLESTRPGEVLTVVSSLADGADRLVARAVLRREGARLVAVLPLPEEEFLEDFATPGSRAEFRSLRSGAHEVVVMPRQPTREAAYRAASEHVLAHSDVLVAVWDGRPAQGAAGTGHVVARARELGLPIAWVHAGNRRPGTMEPVSLGDDQGCVTFEGV